VDALTRSVSCGVERHDWSQLLRQDDYRRPVERRKGGRPHPRTSRETEGHWVAFTAWPEAKSSVVSTSGRRSRARPANRVLPPRLDPEVHSPDRRHRWTAERMFLGRTLLPARDRAPPDPNLLSLPRPESGEGFRRDRCRTSPGRERVVSGTELHPCGILARQAGSGGNRHHAGVRATTESMICSSPTPWARMTSRRTRLRAKAGVLSSRRASLSGSRSQSARSCHDLAPCATGATILSTTSQTTRSLQRSVGSNDTMPAEDCVGRPRRPIANPSESTRRRPTMIPGTGYSRRP
jgi:hypothetical protein